MLRNQRVKANELRKSSQYYNICFITHDNGRVNADKSYLCSFNWRYREDLDNNNANQELKLETSYKINKKEMEQIINFIYTGEFNFGVYNFSEIMRYHEISVDLYIDFLSKHLEEYILKNFQDDKKKCLDLWNYAKKKGLQDWEEQVLNYIVTRAGEFLDLNNVFLEHTQYLKLLEHRKFDLNDDIKCQYLLEWYDYDEQKRKLFIKDLFDKVDITELSPKMREILLKRNNNTFNSKFLDNLNRELELQKNLKEEDWDSLSD